MSFGRWNRGEVMGCEIGRVRKKKGVCGIECLRL